MFTIEYTISRDRPEPIVVESVRFIGHGLFGAEQSAILSFERMKRRHPVTRPDSYRILDHEGIQPSGAHARPHGSPAALQLGR